MQCKGTELKEHAGKGRVCVCEFPSKFSMGNDGVSDKMQSSGSDRWTGEPARECDNGTSIDRTASEQSSYMMPSADDDVRRRCSRTAEV
jgi:hypothetical protein